LDHPITELVPVVPFRAPARRRLHEDVAEQLRDAILDGRFAAGTKLPPERELAAGLGGKRTTGREAIKVREGLGLVLGRQGDGATVRPLVEGSLELLGPMVFHGGRLDMALIGEMAEMMRPMLLEMGRLAIERCRPSDLVAIRKFRDVAADEGLEREERYFAIHELFVLLADMTRNRAWQMLARRLRALFRQEPVRAARARLRRDPGRFVPLIDSCLAAIDRGRKAEAVANLQELIRLLGDFSDVTQEPTRRTRGASK
jgi:GntR family transcriptional repressor for pyruvate dehydrogenase complex